MMGSLTVTWRTVVDRVAVNLLRCLEHARLPLPPSQGGPEVRSRGVPAVEQSKSIPADGQPDGTNACWRATFTSNISWCRLGREDLIKIRAEQVKFIGQSSTHDDARIEWYLTWPRKSVRVSSKPRRSTARPIRV